MKHSIIFCLSGVASSALAFVPAGAPPRVPSAWTDRRGSSAVSLAPGISRRPSCTYMSQTQITPSGLDLSKPKGAKTPDDYQYETSIPDTPMTRKFGHLRGVKVKTVSESVSDFYNNYRRVILPQYRTIVTEYLQSTHLTVYDARFKYDPLFGAGFYTSFMRFMRSYPAEGQAEAIFDAMVKAFGKEELSAQQMRDDAAALKTWAEGKTQEDVVKAMKGEGESDLVSTGFYVARTGLGPFGEGWEEKGEDVDWFLYNRLWAIGVFTLMQYVGVEPTEELVEKWCGVLGINPLGATKDLSLYQEQINKVEQAEQLFKEIEIREKKRMAERLETKAQDAIKAAERAEKEAREDREEEERIANAKEGDVLPNDLPKDT